MQNRACQEADERGDTEVDVKGLEFAQELQGQEEAMKGIASKVYYGCEDDKEDAIQGVEDGDEGEKSIVEYTTNN